MVDLLGAGISRLPNEGGFIAVIKSNEHDIKITVLSNRPSSEMKTKN